MGAILAALLRSPLAQEAAVALLAILADALMSDEPKKRTRKKPR